MAWNKPSNNKPESDPWSNKDSDNKNFSDDKQRRKINQKNIFSDIKNFLYYISNIITRKTNFSSLFKKTIHPFLIIIFISFCIWCISGFYIIKEGERGVVTSFGKFSHLVNPGLNWKPVFIDEVTIINVETVHELVTSDVMLTSDENLVHIGINVQYKITNPSHYLFSVSYPDDSLRQATYSALRSVIGHSTMNRVLTEGRTLVRSDTQKEIEKTIKPYKMGITIFDVNVQTLKPPEEVKIAFDDTIAARENREQYIREAEVYLNEVQHRANNKAQRILEEAYSYSSRIILESQGELNRFSRILPEYRIDRKITLKHLYIESMKRLFGNNKKIFIDTKNRRTFFLFLDKFFSNKNIFNRNFKKNINSKNNNSPLFKKNNVNDPTSLSSLDNILEQRRINSIRSNIENIERQ